MRGGWETEAEWNVSEQAPWPRKFLGHSVTWDGAARLRVSPAAIARTRVVLFASTRSLWLLVGCSLRKQIDAGFEPRPDIGGRVLCPEVHEVQHRRAMQHVTVKPPAGDSLRAGRPRHPIYFVIGHHQVPRRPYLSPPPRPQLDPRWPSHSQ